MKNLIYITLFIALFTSCATKKVNQFSAIEKYQKELVEFYTNPKTTPLVNEEKNNFKGITFFPIDSKYIINADFTRIQDGKDIPFPTSAGKIKHYKEYGFLDFSLDNQKLRLTLYQSSPVKADDDHLFLPFTDDTNGDTTYGGGRYLDFSIKDVEAGNGKVLINFNEAYNPYCAYSKHYNCPIPPGNNSLDVEIRAGVTYKK